MQKIMIDVALFELPHMAEVSARAALGWLWLLRHCTVTANGGRLPKTTTPRAWSRLLPEDTDLGAIVEAGFLIDDGDHWEVFGYDQGAEWSYRQKQAGGRLGAAKRWENKGQGRTPIRTPNGVPNRTGTVRTDVRQTDRQTASTSDSQTDGDLHGEDPDEEGGADGTEEGASPGSPPRW